MNSRPTQALLAVRDLCTEFDTELGPARAVDGVSFDVQPGETLGLVGESGCGKSVTALSILRLVGPPAGRITRGAVEFEGRDLLRLDAEAMRRVRGRDIAMVFQDPGSALNPLLDCGEQIAEVVRAHAGASRREAAAHAVHMLRRVHLPEPEHLAKRYPHELSGGMCQRVMLAIALACDPKLLIADEPTTALDVTIQAQICELLRELRAASGLALLLISHDLDLVAEMADRIAILYAGRVVEIGPTPEVFRWPRHPYTRGLLESLPRLGRRGATLRTIPGSVPHPARWPAHCRFENRCSARLERCSREDPQERSVGEGRRVRCFVDLEAPGT